MLQHTNIDKGIEKQSGTAVEVRLVALFLQEASEINLPTTFREKS